MYRNLCFGLLLLVVAAIIISWPAGIGDHGPVDSVFVYAVVRCDNILTSGKDCDVVKQVC